MERLLLLKFMAALFGLPFEAMGLMSLMSTMRPPGLPEEPPNGEMFPPGPGAFVSGGLRFIDDRLS